MDACTLSKRGWKRMRDEAHCIHAAVHSTAALRMEAIAHG
jgi:hypothetical protein